MLITQHPLVARGGFEANLPLKNTVNKGAPTSSNLQSHQKSSMKYIKKPYRITIR